MKQKRFNFSSAETIKSQAWPEIIANNPGQYPSPLVQELARRALHRAGQPHETERCELCRRNAA